MYFNNTTKEMRVYDGTSWSDLGGGGGAGSLFESNQTLVGIRNHSIANNGTFTMSAQINAQMTFQGQNGSGRQNRLRISPTGIAISSMEGSGAAHEIKADDTGLVVTTNQPLRVNAAPGLTGAVLTSGGSSAAPSWRYPGVMNSLSGDANASSAGLQVLGGFYYNTSLQRVRVYNGTTWRSLAFEP
jgi:hypothetical protein